MIKYTGQYNQEIVYKFSKTFFGHNPALYIGMYR